MRYISFIFIFIISCSSEEDIDISDIINDDVVNEFYSGADLSYVNEMEDCGALYYDSNNNNKDPYKIFRHYDQPEIKPNITYALLNNRIKKSA